MPERSPAHGSVGRASVKSLSNKGISGQEKWPEFESRAKYDKIKNMLRNAIVFTTIPVTNLERAKDFYIGKLGLKQIPDPSKHGFMLEAGSGTKLFIYQKDSWAKDNHVRGAFFVENVEDSVDALSKAGVIFEKEMPDITLNEKGIASTEYEKAAWFKDPDGNMLTLSQILQ